MKNNKEKFEELIEKACIVYKDNLYKDKKKNILKNENKKRK